MKWKRLSMRNHDLKLSKSSASGVMKWWLLKRRLESALSRVMKQIKVSIVSAMLIIAEENKKLKEAMKLMEKNIQRAQHEQDLTKSNTWDLEY